MTNVAGMACLSLLFLALIIGLTGVGSCVSVQENLSSTNETENIARFDWTALRNTNTSILDDMKVNLTVNNPAEEKEIEDISGRLKEEINKSVSYETSDVSSSIKYELFFILRDPTYRYSGPAALTDYFSVTVFRTVTDPLVSKPSYLSREYVVKYNITFVHETPRDRMEDTIGWYESDASGIVRYLMDTGIGGNIAVTVINFNDAEEGGSVSFVLEAEDLEKLKEYWDDDDSYIRYFDWSEIVSDKEGLIYYEDPSKIINLPEGLSSGITGEIKAGDIDENLKSDLKSQSYELMETVDSIRRSVSAGNLEETQKCSEELMELSRKFSSGIVGYSTDDESEALIDEYISGVRYLSKAGSHYWDKALLPGEIYSDDSYEDLREGIERINNALGYVGESGYNPDELQIGSSGLDSGYLIAGTAFHYRDNTESNDISIKITNYYLKNKLLLKEGSAMEYKEAEFGKRYIGVVVDIRHLGYRGKGRQQITTPDINSFVFYYDGKTYTPVNVENYIEDMGEVYSKRTLNRLERYESLVIFEIDKGNRFDPEKAYVEVDLGKYGKQIWQLSSDL